MAKLRDPDGGCPWDLEQDFKSIAPYTIEEAYEVADAIERENMDNLREELGDLLFQPVYHAQMASEQGKFTIDDIIHDVTEKMIRRHPHVFGNKAANTAFEVNDIWDTQKKAEKSLKPDNGNKSLLGDIPKAFPALLRLHKLQKKAAKTGFEWPSKEDAFKKINEEFEELKEAIKNNDQSNIAEEIGDMFLALSNYARMSGLNAETIGRSACEKFERRFRGMEKDAANENKTLNDYNLNELLDFWKRQK